MLTLIAAENLLAFLVEKDTIRNNLSFQLTNISGNIPKIKGSKIYNFSITRLGRKRKLPMQEPIETIIVRAQQNFDIVGGLNPVQIEIEDDRILNALKKYINILYYYILVYYFQHLSKTTRNKYLPLAEN